jgi:hypothetical protein
MFTNPNVFSSVFTNPDVFSSVFTNPSVFSSVFQTQFVVVILHTAQLSIMQDCDYPAQIGYLVGVYNFIFLCLFLRFYIKTYNRRRVILSNRNEYNIAKNGFIINEGMHPEEDPGAQNDIRYHYVTHRTRDR